MSDGPGDDSSGSREGQQPSAGQGAGARSYDQSGSGQSGSAHPGSAQPGYGEYPYGQPAYGSSEYGQSNYGRHSGDQQASAQAQYGQGSYGQSSYGQGSYGQSPYGQSSSGQSPYGQSSYGQPPSYSQASYPVPEPPESGMSWSGLAIAGFVLSFIPGVCLVVGLPLAIAGIVATRASRKRGRGLAIAGVVIAVVQTALLIILSVVLAVSEADRDASGRIVGEGRLDFSDVRSGDCLNIKSLKPGGTVRLGFSDLSGVPCTTEHNAQAYSVIALGSGSYNQLAIQSRLRECVSGYPNSADSTTYQPLPFYPEKSLWNEDKNNHLVCLVVRRDLTKFSGDFSD
jgi:hypothetical protein